MIIIAAVDDRGGMTFNHRRQSRDKVMRERILNLTAGSRLWMNSYSYKLFEESDRTSDILADEDFLKKASPDDYCLVENISVKSYADKIEKIIIFKWNRKYPGNTYFDVDLSTWKMVYSEEFAGSSHEKITMEVYEK